MTMTTKTLRHGGALLAAVTLTGCISNPLPAGNQAALYAWGDLDDPVALREGIVNEDHDGRFDGDLDFTTLLLDSPGLDTGADTPYVLKACELEICYYAVLFPGDFTRKKDDMLGGFAALTPLSTAMYADVKGLPAEQVRPRLDALATQVTVMGGPQDYAGFVALDYLRNEQDAAQITRMSDSERAEASIQQGELPSLQALLDDSITRTGELQAPADFIFSSAWELTVDVDVSARMDRAYLTLCSDFAATEGGYDVDYSNCLLKTPLPDGGLSQALRMSADTDALLAIVMPLDNPAQREYHLWQREGSEDTLRVR